MYNLPCCRNPRVVRWLKAEVSLPTPLAPGGVDGGVRIVSIRRPEHVEPISLNEPPLEPLRIFLRSLQRCGSCRELGAEGGEFGVRSLYIGFICFVHYGVITLRCGELLREPLHGGVVVGERHYFADVTTFI